MPHDVVVLGQVARDLVLGVSRLPGPGGSATAQRHWEGLGGKGANQALACRGLGVGVAVVGVVGDDTVGDDVLRQAEADGLDVHGVVRREGVATALLVDVVEDDATRRLLEDVPDGVLLTAEDVRRSADAVAGCRSLLVQLQQPGDAVLEAVGIARDAGASVVADGAVEADEVRDTLLRAATVWRADAHEAELLLGRELADVGEVVRAAEDLVEAGPSVVALAAGSDGNVVAWRGGSAVLPLVDVATADPTGGGDSFSAGLAVALLRGLPPEEAGWWGSGASALTVTRRGGRPDLDVEHVQDVVARSRGR